MKSGSSPALKKIARCLILILLVLGTLTACFLMFEYSLTAPGTTAYIKSMPASAIYLSLATLGVVWALIYLLLNRIWLSCLLLSCLSGILAIINFYVRRFHSMPLSFLLLRNLQTALNVIGSSPLRMDTRVFKLIGLTVGLIAASCAVGFVCREKKLHGRRRWLRSGVLVALSALVLYTGYFSQTPIKPKDTLSWSWRESYQEYGYIPSTFESGCRLFSTCTKPEGYSQQAVADIELPPAPAQTSETLPDVFLILNETFYDIRQLIDIETDIPLTPYIDSMDNLLRGYAVVPAVAGATNSSEYELLTSHSLQLMPGITPFNALDLQTSNSIARHLSALGYTTLAAHSEQGLNYSRSVSYPELGFDQSYFRREFTELAYPPGRHFATDESLYRHCLDWYAHDMGEESPRFLYLLTIQNHSEHNLSAPENDLVHVVGDYGDYTQPLNEFLTGIHLSDQAFYQLTEQFKTIDRPVIICMVGDHCPTLASDMGRENANADELELLRRKVPLLIWANYDLPQKELDTMSMNMVIPTLLETAGIPLSPYYNYLLQLKENTPILTSYGKYYDREGRMYAYDSDTGVPYEKIVDDYFYLEYQNIATNHAKEVYQPY